MAQEPSADSELFAESSFLTRRLRHITSIQVRNLTPFPVRDAFTSALAQPSDSLRALSVANDDLNIPLSRRRPRKISANSIATTRSSLKWDEGLAEDEGATFTTGFIRGRKTSGSRVNFAPGNGTGPIPPSPKPSSFKFQRPRTNSKASSTSSRIRTSIYHSNIAGDASSFLPDHTQKGLEKVIHSRLLETCLVISVTEYPPESSSTESLIPKSAALPSPSHFDARGRQPPRSAPPTKIRAVPSYRQSPISPVSRRIRSRSPEIYSNSHETPEFSTPESKKSHLLPSLSGRPKVFPSPKLRPKLQHLLETPRPKQEATFLTYRSPIHRPSTNPNFPLGAGSISQSLGWTRLNAQAFRVTIWGKLPEDVQRAGWDEVHPPPYPEESGFHWRIVQEWDVHLEDLMPLPDDKHISSLPSNTFLITLEPHGRIYYSPRQARIPSRASSPSTGYVSDPESELHKVKRAPTGSEMAPSMHSRRRRRGANLTDSKDIAKTATWPDIFQLATLQALIHDNDASLSTIGGKVDSIIAEDHVSPLKRGISERQDRISELESNHQQVLDACAQKRERIRAQTEALRQRRELLSFARQSIREGEVAEQEIAEDVDKERSQLASLRLTMSSMRSNLVAVLTDIFPIELYSPPDLLFTIFDVALPLPLSTNDPAPPLSVPEHKDINEDSVATALGYVAQALQLLAAYLGTSLLYPVTCIGSRSLIRDGISAMIGPRMFPLYSKGVDTYRFEYGVFLLNKNIEILMVEKDLRALDMRHTLPNLKNLLLILSHDSTRPSDVPRSRALHPSPSTLSLLSLNSEASREDAVLGDADSPTPKATKRTEDEGSGIVRTPPPSGTTTPIPTPVSDDSRTSRFLALAPFTGFLRGRYPSTSRASTKSVQEEDGDEEDRSTIHGLVRDVDRDEAATTENQTEPKERDAPPINIGTTLPT